MASRALLLVLTFALPLILEASEASAYSCTDGQTCLCDCYANTDGTSNDTGSGAYANATCEARGIPKRSVDFCEDFENALLNDGDTQVYNDQAVIDYGDDARWGDGWSQVYGPTAGDCLGSLPSGQGIKARGAEGTHSWSCFNIVQEGACEITDSDCVYDGTSSLSLKQRPGSESSMGSGKTFATPRRKSFGITMMMRWSDNYVSPHDPGTESVAHKTDQFLTSGGSCNFGCSTTNAGASQTPFGSVFLELEADPEAPDGVVSIGSTEFTETSPGSVSGGWRYTAPSNLYTFQRGTWRCFQQKVTGLGEENGSVTHWVDGTKVFEATNLDLIYKAGTGAAANNNGANEILFDNYYNTGYDGSTLAMRGEDNIVFSNGDPVPCAEVANASGGQTPTITISSVTSSDSTPAFNTAIAVTVTFASAYTTGNFSAKVDCENDGGYEDGTQTGANSPIAVSGVCAYASSGAKTIGVQVTDTGPTATDTDTVGVTVESAPAGPTWSGVPGNSAGDGYYTPNGSGGSGSAGPAAF